MACLGHAFGPNDQRGVFRSRDGGANWERVLHRNAETGAIDLCIDPTNPRVLYAALWQVIPPPWILESGGPGSGIFKSTDGGDSWTEISGNPGLPEGIKGRIGIACSPAKSGRVWAIVEAEKGALLRSEDGGANWEVASAERDLRQRPWYYHHVFADPQDADTVWVLNLQAWKSTDAGKTFTGVSTPHGDNHDLWIGPRRPAPHDRGQRRRRQHLLQRRRRRGRRSTTRRRRNSIARRPSTTSIPYRVYGTQQDNSAISVPSHSDKGIIRMSDCYTVGNSESGHIQVRPDNPDIVYSGAIGSAPGGGGVLLRYDHATAQIRIITAWPEEFSGYGPKDLKYRFQWTYPILISPHDPDVLYIAGNVLFRSTDDGASWEVISPDLTRDDKSKQEPSGRPDHQGHHRRRALLHHLRLRRVPAPAGAVLGRLRRRPDAPLARRRRHLAGDHAARPARMGDRGHHRAVPARPGDRLRGRLPLQARRLPPVPVQDRRLRRDLDADHRQPARRRLHAGHTRGSRASGSAVRRHRARPVRLLRRRRVLAAVQPQPAGRPHPRPGDPRRRPDRGHPWPVVLDHRRPGAGGGSWRQARSPRCTCSSLPPRCAWRATPTPPRPRRKQYAVGLGIPGTLYVAQKPDGGFERRMLDAGANPRAGVVLHYHFQEQPEGEVTLSFQDADGAEIRGFSSVSRSRRRPTARSSRPRIPWCRPRAGMNRFAVGHALPGLAPDHRQQRPAARARSPHRAATKRASPWRAPPHRRWCEIRKDPRIPVTQEELQGAVRPGEAESATSSPRRTTR